MTERNDQKLAFNTVATLFSCCNCQTFDQECDGKPRKQKRTQNTHYNLSHKQHGLMLKSFRLGNIKATAVSLLCSPWQHNSAHHKKSLFPLLKAPLHALLKHTSKYFDLLWSKLCGQYHSKILLLLPISQPMRYPYTMPIKRSIAVRVANQTQSTTTNCFL